MDLKQELQKIGIFLNDAVIDYINQYCDNEIVRAKEKQREKEKLFEKNMESREFGQSVRNSLVGN